MQEYDILCGTTAEQIYLNDLDALESALRQLEDKERKAELDAIMKGQKLAKKGKAKGSSAGSKPQRKATQSLNLETNMKLNFKDPTGVRFVPEIEAKPVKKVRVPKVVLQIFS